MGVNNIHTYNLVHRTLKLNTGVKWWKHHTVGQVPERPNGADCKSAVFRLQWFESTPAHGKAIAFSMADVINGN